jgi:hypothetical protein
VQTINNTLLYRIYGHGRGWVFFPNEFVDEFDRKQIDNALSDLAAEGKIRRICRGMYDYPKYSELLGKTLNPDFDQVAHAFARYTIGSYKLEFKKTALKEIGFKHRESGVIVQALKSLGKERVTPEILEKIRNELTPGIGAKILKDTKTVTGWVYECIKEICREGTSGQDRDNFLGGERWGD